MRLNPKQRAALADRLLGARAVALGVDVELLREAIRLQDNSRMLDLVIVDGAVASRTKFVPKG